MTRPVSKPFSDSNVTDDEFGNGSEARFERRIHRKLRKATKKVEQPHVEQRDLENLRRIPKRRKKRFRTARLLKISFAVSPKLSKSSEDSPSASSDLVGLWSVSCPPFKDKSPVLPRGRHIL